MNRDAQQVKVRQVTLMSILRSPSFVEGYLHAKMGVPLVDWYERGKQWDYERGRLFYFCDKRWKKKDFSENIYLIHASFNRACREGSIT